jgi:hypothetical protein
MWKNPRQISGVVSVCVALSANAFAQAPASFEVASIKRTAIANGLTEFRMRPVLFPMIDSAEHPTEN